MTGVLIRMEDRATQRDARNVYIQKQNHIKRQPEGNHCKPRREISEKTSPTTTLILDF